MSRPQHDGSAPGEVEFKDGVVWIWNGTSWRSGDASEQRSDHQVDEADLAHDRVDEDR